MKMMTTNRQIEIIREMFDKYVEPVASGFMCGEVPSTVFEIHRRGTREGDWLAFVRFRNTLTISVFRCAVYLEDIVRLCRRCKIWLLTEPVYEVVVTYFMLHPLYQSQCMDFTHDNLSDYESMFADAGKLTYRFIKKHFTFYEPVQKTVLEILNIHNQIFTNRNVGYSLKNAMEENRLTYKGFMMNRYPMAYKTSTHFKASSCIVDADGFMHLEKREEISHTEYMNGDDVSDILKEQEVLTQKEIRRNRKEKEPVVPNLTISTAKEIAENERIVAGDTTPRPRGRKKGTVIKSKTKRKKIKTTDEKPEPKTFTIDPEILAKYTNSTTEKKTRARRMKMD